MTTEFKWTGINVDGKKITSTIHAINQKIARDKLMHSDITILSLKKNNPTFSFNHKNKLSLKQRLDFTQQLHLLLQASIPLTDALSLIAQTTQHKSIQAISNSLNEKIITGISLSSALMQQSDCFDKTYCQMIAAGEHSGKLEIVLEQLIDNQERRAQIHNKIGKALFYPLSVMCIALIISVGLLIFVIPQFSAIYESFGAQLPTITRCLISMSHYLCRQGILYLIILAVIIFTLKNMMHQLLFRIPYCRSLQMTQQTAQWSQLLAMTLSSGIPMIDALHIANHAISQPMMHSHMQRVQDAVIAGKSLFAALDQCLHFPARAKTMIGIGENADALPQMMKRIAVIYQQQLNDTLDRLSKLLEPVIMMLVASMVSGLIIAMYLPIFRMGSIV